MWSDRFSFSAAQVRKLAELAIIMSLSMNIPWPCCIQYINSQIPSCTGSMEIFKYFNSIANVEVSNSYSKVYYNIGFVGTVWC